MWVPDAMATAGAQQRDSGLRKFEVPGVNLDLSA